MRASDVGGQCASHASTSTSTRATASSGVVAQYTHYEANTWILTLKHSGIKVLTDPWFVSTLTFAGQTWFFEGEKLSLKENPVDLDEVLKGVDFILLSQDLDDHTHQPTLKAMPKHIPVISGPGAAAIAKDLGYTNVTAMQHGEQLNVCDGKMTITASKGALVGPPWSERQHGWKLQESGGVSVYYEPHASHDLESVKQLAPVDIAIIPTTSTYAGGYPLVEGLEGAADAIRVLSPKVVVPLINNSVSNTGVLTKILSSAGSNSPEEVKNWLATKRVQNVTVAGPQEFGTPLDITLSEVPATSSA
eukprot:TRINITY_DN19034_c0_g2_i1.p1 TRINITY_DN19034_c0_g2~~TRINITY_DN19034_c0_g2_i1.p1  ORF type:complete len:347 (+),score=33.47 TRINITY_DN19034_c0_g2_i1:127-1041(+)